MSDILAQIIERAKAEEAAIHRYGELAMPIVNPDTLVHEEKIEQDESTLIIFRRRTDKEIPASVKREASNIVHNLRSIIDNVVFHSTQKYGSDIMTQMLFSKSKEEYEKKFRKYRCESVSADILQWVLSHQPFHTDPKVSDLCKLNEISRHDKHRTPAMSIVFVRGLGLRCSVRSFVYAGPDESEPNLLAVMEIDRGAEYCPPVFEFDIGFTDPPANTRALFTSVLAEINDTLIPLAKKHLAS